MSKRNRDKKNQNKVEVKVQTPVHMSAEELQHIIANAIVEADEIKEANRRKQQENERKEWRAAIGYREFHDKNAIIRVLKTFFNRFCSFVRICFMSKDKINGDRFSFGLIKLFLEMTFWGARWLLNLLTIGAGAAIFIHYFELGTIDTSTLNPIDAICIGTLTFLMSRFCRIASVEVEKLEDRSYLFSLVAAIASLVTVVGAAITIVRTIV